MGNKVIEFIKETATRTPLCEGSISDWACGNEGDIESASYLNGQIFLAKTLLKMLDNKP